MKIDVEHSADKVFPAAAITTFTLFGLTLSELSYLAIATYYGFMAAHFAVSKWFIPLYQRTRAK